MSSVKRPSGSKVCHDCATGWTSGTLQPRRARTTNSIELTACSPCTPPAVATSPTGLFVRYGGSRAASRISQSRAFLNEPLTEPWYVGVLQIRASLPWTVSASSRAPAGAARSGVYIGRSRSRTQIRLGSAFAARAPSSAVSRAVRLVDPVRSEPPRPTTRTDLGMIPPSTTPVPTLAAILAGHLT